jgi:hypothetical protein
MADHRECGGCRATGDAGAGCWAGVGENEKIFTKSAFLPSDFAEYVQNPRYDLRGVGHLFFLAIENAGSENRKLRWNRPWRAAVRSGVAGYMREKKKRGRRGQTAERPTHACPGLSAAPKRSCTPGLKPGYGVVPSLLRTTTLSHICNGCLCGSL